MNKKTILILSYSNLESDPRILRQIRALKDDFNIQTLAFSPVKDKDIGFYSIYSTPPFSLTRKLKRAFHFFFGMYDKYYWDITKQKLMGQLQKKHFDAIIANDIYTLPLALAIASDKPIVYFDAHEYHPKEFEENLNWRIFHKPYIEFLCKKYIPKSTFFSTVADGISNEYNSFVGLLPIVITNASNYFNIEPSEVNGNKIRLIHHGAAIKGRQIENMIEMMQLVDKRYSLYLMLTGKGSFYYEQLVKLASVCTNVFFVDPVPFDQIVNTINQYDIGIYCLPPTNFNNKNALPNKFFEFIQAKLALVVSPNPEMAKLVLNYELGKVADSFSIQSMANVINSITVEELKKYKEKSKLISKKICAEENLKKINQIIKEIINSNS